MVGIKHLYLSIAIVVAVLFAGLSLFMFIKLKESQKYEKQAAKTVDQAVRIIERTTDGKGQNHVKFDAEAQNITKEMAKNIEPIRGTLDTAAKALDIQAKQIEHWQRIALTSQAKELQARAEVDSLKKTRFRYQNDYIDLTYTPGEYLENIQQPGQFGYKYNISLTQTQYRKNGKRLIDIYANDTNAIINGVERLTIIPKEPYFRAKLLANNLYTRPKNVLHSGFKLQTEFGKVSLSGARYYNFGTGKWETHYEAGLVLLKY